MTVPGIDISHWQAQTPPLGNIGFVFVKATEGTAVDPMWKTHTANVQASTAVLGAYHVARDDVNVETQAAAFLNTAKGVELLALDVEGAHAFNRDETGRFFAAVHKTGRRCGLYMSESGFYAGVGQDFNWVANWSQAPSIPYAFWQYGSRMLGTMKVDGDTFRYGMTELLGMAGLLPDSSTGDAMQKFTVTEPVIGKYVLTSDTNLIAMDGSAVPVTKGRAGSVFAKATLPDGRTAYLVPYGNTTGLLVADGHSTYTEFPTITQADLDAAKAAEHERIAVAEADRIRAI